MINRYAVKSGERDINIVVEPTQGRAEGCALERLSVDSLGYNVAFRWCNVAIIYNGSKPV